MSDCHRGDGNWEDSFAPNQNLYYSALSHYYRQNYTYIEIGDGDELWKNKDFLDIANIHNDIFKLLNKFFAEDRLHLIYGNHDIVKSKKEWIRKNLFTFTDEQAKRKIPLFEGIEIHNGIVLDHKETGNQIFLLHGHQADFFNDTLWILSRFLVRHFVRVLEQVGVHDPTSAAKNHTKRNSVEKKLVHWSEENRQMIIAGHTHRPTFPDIDKTPYFNDGCCVQPHSITGIEIAKGEIALVIWRFKTKSDGTLYAGKDVLAGPIELAYYFAYNK